MGRLGKVVMIPKNHYTPGTNYRIPLVTIGFKVGTHSSSQWLVRKRDMYRLKPGEIINIYSGRWANPLSVLVNEFRAGLWFVERF